MTNNNLAALQIGSDHAYSCTCNTCADWWRMMGPDPDSNRYGPFGETLPDQVVDESDPLDLTTEAGVYSYLMQTQSNLDLRVRCGKIKEANGGDYPSFWWEVGPQKAYKMLEIQGVI